MRTLIIFTFTILQLSVSVKSQSKYPDFDREFWVNSQCLAKGKMKRGAGLGVLGLISVWPATLIINHAKDNPQKYEALSAVLALSSLGATLHGFGSVGFGKKQNDAAAAFINRYDNSPDSVDINKEQSARGRAQK